jgi:hypothetical protein
MFISTGWIICWALFFIGIGIWLQRNHDIKTREHKEKQKQALDALNNNA